MDDIQAVISYARDNAPADVVETFDWLLQAGFDITRARGGKDESFGNVAIELASAALRAVIVRDRGQWSMDLAQGDGDYLGLHLLQTAMYPDVYPPDLGSVSQLGSKLPPDSVWAVMVPQLVDWLTSGDRSEAIARARQGWQEEIDNRLGGPR